MSSLRVNETGVRLWLVMDGIHPQWLSYPKTACTNGEGVDHVSKVEEENDAIDMSDSRQAVLKDLEYMFQPAFARSYVHEIKTTALRDIPHASYWAHEAIEEWFKSGDMNAPIHELLRKDVETSARDFYVSMGRSVDNYSLAHAVTQEIMDAQVDALVNKSTSEHLTTLIARQRQVLVLCAIRLRTT